MNIPNSLTRYFLIYAAEHKFAARLAIFQELAAAWDRLEIQRVRLFLGGGRRIYVSIGAKQWAENGEARDAAAILAHPDVAVSNVTSCPHPQKWFTGTWKVFTLADTLTHFATITWGERT